MERVFKENIQKQENLKGGEIKNKMLESSKKAQQVKTLAEKPNTLSPVPATHKVETKNSLLQVGLWPLHALLSMDIHYKHTKSIGFNPQQPNKQSHKIQNAVTAFSIGGNSHLVL